jgi:cell pole-organizing protein PopZ
MVRPLGRDLVPTIQSGAAPEQSVEEILRSIRRILAELDSPAGPASPRPLPDYTPTAGANPFAPVNHDDWHAEIDGETPDDIQLAIEKALDGFSAVLTDIVRVGDHVSLPSSGEEGHRSANGRTNDAHAPRLLSSQNGAPVADSLEELAQTFPRPSHSEVGAMAEEMLRPMLKDWLDRNLPGLVKRLVGDEITRVSRRR